MAVPRNIPVLLKHNTIGIYDGKHVKGGAGPERFENAFNIARARLVEYGFLMEGSEPPGAIEDIQLTSKGRTKDREKARALGTAPKQARFDRMYEAWREGVEKAER